MSLLTSCFKYFVIKKSVNFARKTNALVLVVNAFEWSQKWSPYVGLTELLFLAHSGHFLSIWGKVRISAKNRKVLSLLSSYDSLTYAQYLEKLISGFWEKCVADGPTKRNVDGGKDRLELIRPHHKAGWGSKSKYSNKNYGDQAKKLDESKKEIKKAEKFKR